MAPDNAVITGGAPPGGTARALVEPGRAMAIYLRKTAPASGPATATSTTGTDTTDLQIALAEGQWRAEWVDTMTGAVLRTGDVKGGGVRAVSPPDYAADIALRLRRQ
jgi:hypothetical protein